MAKKRDRYVISGNMSANGVSLKGVVLVDCGLCGHAGRTKTDNGKKLIKSDLKYRKFKFENPKLGKELGLPKVLTELVLDSKHISTFLTKQTEEDNT